jgi:hypothetical protein
LLGHHQRAMQPTTHTPTGETGDPPRAPAPPAAEPRGCLFALSQPPLMVFLAVIGALLALCGVHDLFWL